MLKQKLQRQQHPLLHHRQDVTVAAIRAATVAAMVDGNSDAVQMAAMELEVAAETEAAMATAMAVVAAAVVHVMATVAAMDAAVAVLAWVPAAFFPACSADGKLADGRTWDTTHRTTLASEFLEMAFQPTSTTTMDESNCNNNGSTLRRLQTAPVASASVVAWIISTVQMVPTRKLSDDLTTTGIILGTMAGHTAMPFLSCTAKLLMAI